jgi:hypothetical protein
MVASTTTAARVVDTMTERPTPERPIHQPEPAAAPARARQPARRRRPGPGAVITASVATFAMMFGFLAYQLRSGHDPAIGAAGAASPNSPGKVLVRRVIRRRVVTTVVPSTASAATVSSSSGPVVTSSAATTAAPTPAPVTTSAS